MFFGRGGVPIFRSSAKRTDANFSRTDSLLLKLSISENNNFTFPLASPRKYLVYEVAIFCISLASEKSVTMAFSKLKNA